MPTLAEFLAGKPLDYTTLSGRPVRATWKLSNGLHYLHIEDTSGRILASPIAPEHDAINFYNTMGLSA